MTPQEQSLAAAKAGFCHGWDAALEEAILIAETEAFHDKSAAEVVDALRQLRDANSD